MGKNVMVIPETLEMSLLGASSIAIDDVLIFTVRPPRLSPGQILTKRVFDLMASVALLLLSSPIVLIASILVRLTSKGPIIFKQDRVGKDGEEFTLYKLRTMVNDAEEQTGPVLAQESDPRITKLGCILRATRIDELPQLFNVLVGNMSMIGPRPEREFFVNKFRETVQNYDLRFAVKPGITGLAQVAGGYSTTVVRKLRFDLLYIYDYSLMLDFRILLRTVLVVLHREQARGMKATPKSDIRLFAVEEER
jgi:exopolysaccharide biosynthesis polyprenyl glycosylphosphotransferase